MPNLVRAVALSTHPGPTIAVTAMMIALGASAGVEPLRLLMLGLAMLFNQASVGLSNDWLDAGRDRATGRRDKPVARGELSEAAARNAALACAAAAVVFSIPLGAGAIVAHGVSLASAWAYNLGLKATALSILPYLVSFGLLPLIVTLSRHDHALAASWAIAAGALLGAAAHFANVLPDLDDDARTGIRGLPHRLGARASGIAAFVVLACASALVALGPVGAVSAWQWAGLGLVVLISIVGIVLVSTRRPTRLMFRLIIAGAAVDVAMLVLSGGRMLG